MGLALNSPGGSLRASHCHVRLPSAGVNIVPGTSQIATRKCAIFAAFVDPYAERQYQGGWTVFSKSNLELQPFRLEENMLNKSRHAPLARLGVWPQLQVTSSTIVRPAICKRLFRSCAVEFESSPNI